MKKTALWTILLLAVVAFIAVYTMQQDEGIIIGNTTIVRPSTVNEVADDADDLAEEVEDVIQGIIDEVEQEIEDGQEVVEDAMDDAGEAMDDALDAGEEDTVVVVENNGYVEYDADMVAASVQAGKDVVLFFHADRCPTCNALEENINENSSDIDENTVLVKVDYDTAEELKTEYGVTAQHTLVYLNENGELKTKERASMTLSEIQDTIDA